MAASKLHTFLFFSIFLGLVFTLVQSDVGVGSDDSDAAFRVEVDKLTSKIHELESLVEKKSHELKSKDEAIAHKEKAIAEKEQTIKEKADSITSLRSEVASLEAKGSLDANEEVKKAQTRAHELEKQVEKLQMELQLKNNLREALETRTKDLEKKMLDLDPKLHDLQKVADEQKKKLRKTERALKIAEEELKKAKSEATAKIRELTEVHGAWLPPWLAARLVAYQSKVENHWKEHGKPAFESFKQTKWVPAAREKWVLVITNAEPQLQALTKKTQEVYIKSKDALTPHMIKIKEVVDPHYQTVKKVCKPYIDDIATATKPHLDKARETVAPYTKEAVIAYGKFLESATKYHDQVQGVVEESLKKHDISKALATKELVWFAASALLALPVIILLKTLSAIFFKKAKKPNPNPNQPRRKAKRAHPEK
ncbi:hypothetical protein CTI12_AA168300 [Artemisia annua]|uniref:Myosin heavy chain-related protein n=1 Tax=Artemisia annua TaxID=35608 RepID=A0A2U1PCI7_ARTAN|nr:hypothetical protein CTI12_AA168300 [Artemisia annua]